MSMPFLPSVLYYLSYSFIFSLFLDDRLSFHLGNIILGLWFLLLSIIILLLFVLMFMLDIVPSLLWCRWSAAVHLHHTMKIFKKRLSKGLDLRKFFFSQRVVDNWISLPDDVISAKTVNQFKNNYDNYLKETGYGVLKGISLY